VGQVQCRARSVSSAEERSEDCETDSLQSKHVRHVQQKTGQKLRPRIREGKTVVQSRGKEKTIRKSRVVAWRTSQRFGVVACRRSNCRRATKREGNGSG